MTIVKLVAAATASLLRRSYSCERRWQTRIFSGASAAAPPADWRRPPGCCTGAGARELPA